MQKASDIAILKIDSSQLSDNDIYMVARGIEEVRRITWLATYINEDIGISRKDIEENFLPLQESTERTATMVSTDTTSQIWIAKDGENIIGFCIANTIPQPQIGAIYIYPEYQGKGIGSQLMQHTLNWFGEDIRVHLEVVAYNDNAIDFYKKFGFQEEGRGEYPLRNLIPQKFFPTIKMIR